MVEIDKICRQFRAELENELQRILGKPSSPVYDVMSYHMGWIDELGHPQNNTVGKRLRPTLCLLACRAAGGQWKKALPAAAAIELIHNFSLIHDDIEDLSRVRRGRKAVWYIWGQPQAINAGDGMYALALSSLLNLEKTSIPPDKVLKAAALLNEASLRICEGQYLDMSYEKRLNVKTVDYFSMISRKTAALFRCSLSLGALLATDDELIADRLGNFGHALGIAFQIRDDAISIWGDEKRTGKPGNSDISMGKKNLPVIYALHKSRGGNRNLLNSIYAKNKIEHDDVQEVLRIINEVNARSYTQAMCENYYHEAISELENLDITHKDKAALQTIAAFSLERDY